MRLNRTTTTRDRKPGMGIGVLWVTVLYLIFMFLATWAVKPIDGQQTQDIPACATSDLFGHILAEGALSETTHLKESEFLVGGYYIGGVKITVPPNGIPHDILSQYTREPYLVEVVIRRARRR